MPAPKSHSLFNGTADIFRKKVTPVKDFFHPSNKYLETSISLSWSVQNS